MNRYLFITLGDTEPKIVGPFETEEERSKAARRHKGLNGDDDGIFPLNIHKNGKVESYSYCGAFFEVEE